MTITRIIIAPWRRGHDLIAAVMASSRFRRRTFGGGFVERRINGLKKPISAAMAAQNTRPKRKVVAANHGSSMGAPVASELSP